MPDILVDGELRLFGAVGVGWAFEGFTAYDVHNALARIGRNKDIVIRLNSPGGIAHEGVAIYNALKTHKGKKTIYVEAVAASAASVIAMAGDDVVMRLGSYMMIHDPAMLTLGDAAEHEKAVEMLDVLGDSIAEIYAERAGISTEEARDLMREETWLTASKAVERKFAHRTDKAKAGEPTAFDYRLFQHAPKQILNLSDSRGWSNAQKETTSSEAPEEPESPTMTEAEKAEQARKEAEAKAAQDAATAKAVADATARASAIMAACSEAGFPDMAAALVADTSVTADAAKAKCADWKAIAATCASAKKVNPKVDIDAATMIKAGKTPAQASAEVLDRLAAAQAEDVSGAHLGGTGGSPNTPRHDPFAPPSAATMAAWDKVLTGRYGEKLLPAGR